MNGLFFVEDCNEHVLSGAYLACVSPVHSVQDLYVKLAETLDFPNYFGKNWDALIDLYRDFTWIEQKAIVIFHKDLSGLSDSELETYLECVLICLDTWSDGLEHCISFVFSHQDEKRICHILSDKMNDNERIEKKN